MHIFRWCLTHVHIFRLFHAVGKKFTGGGTKLCLQTDGQDDSNIPPKIHLHGCKKKQGIQEVFHRKGGNTLLSLYISHDTKH